MLKIEIKTGGAAFQSDFESISDGYAAASECIRILKNIIIKLEDGCTDGSCMDINGNKIGTWKLDL